MGSRTLNSFMIDSEPSGRIKYSIPFWTGVVFKIPRTLVSECTDRNEYKYAGVYFLLGKDEETGRGIVYIGQAVHRKNGEGLVNRLKEHMKDPGKDYWNEAIIVTTVDDRLGPTEISYLEHTFCNKAISANRYIVKNGNDPNIGRPSEEMQDALDDFIRITELIIGYAQHKVFEPLIDPASAEKDLLYFNYSSASGKGKITSDGFVIMKGSKIRVETTDSCPSSVLVNREKYKDVLVDGKLTEDILLSSPSAAAAFLGSASLNGYDHWKNADGVTLKKLGK